MKSSIKAKLPTEPVNNAMQPNKPVVGTASLVAMVNGGLRGVITIKVYMSPSHQASMVYACFWLRASDGTWYSGKGSAGGYGYHKDSAAIAAAVSDAGIELYGSPYSNAEGDVDMKQRCYFGGTGSSAYPDIFKAIARAAGYRGRMLFIDHL